MNSTESLFRDNTALLNLATQRRVDVKQYGTVIQPSKYTKRYLPHSIVRFNPE